jgi:hypothetical protein
VVLEATPLPLSSCPSGVLGRPDLTFTKWEPLAYPEHPLEDRDSTLFRFARCSYGDPSSPSQHPYIEVGMVMIREKRLTS